jgi:hypothetical protein
MPTTPSSSTTGRRFFGSLALEDDLARLITLGENAEKLGTGHDELRADVLRSMIGSTSKTGVSRAAYPHYSANNNAQCAAQNR